MINFIWHKLIYPEKKLYGLQFMRWMNELFTSDINIVIHRQIVSLYRNPSVWLHTLDAWSWDRNPPNFTLDLV